jgi:hypothetical protein
MNYVDIQRRANDLLKSAGLKVTITRDGSTVSSGYAVFTQKRVAPENESATYSLALTPTTKRVALLSGLAKEPAVGDTLTGDKVTYTVTAVETVRPAATTVLYKVEVA